MYEIRETCIDEVLAAQALLEKHWDEIARNKRVMVLKPDVKRYHNLEAAGLLFTVGAYVDAQLVGYSVNIVSPHLHYSDLVVASNDVLYIDPEHRAGKLGLRLMRATEGIAKEAGAQLMLWHAKQGTRLNDLLPRLGYGVQDIIYSKEL